MLLLILSIGPSLIYGIQALHLLKFLRLHIYCVSVNHLMKIQRNFAMLGGRGKNSEKNATWFVYGPLINNNKLTSRSKVLSNGFIWYMHFAIDTCSLLLSIRFLFARVIWAIIPAIL